MAKKDNANPPGERVRERDAPKGGDTDDMPMQTAIAQMLRITVSQLQSKPPDVQEVLRYTYVNGCAAGKSDAQIQDTLSSISSLDRETRRETKEREEQPMQAQQTAREQEERQAQMQQRFSWSQRERQEAYEQMQHADSRFEPPPERVR